MRWHLLHPNDVFNIMNTNNLTKQSLGALELIIFRLFINGVAFLRLQH
jgi:hypothetical protein